MMLKLEKIEKEKTNMKKWKKKKKKRERKRQTHARHANENTLRFLKTSDRTDNSTTFLVFDKEEEGKKEKI